MSSKWSAISNPRTSKNFTLAEKRRSRQRLLGFEPLLVRRSLNQLAPAVHHEDAAINTVVLLCRTVLKRKKAALASLPLCAGKAANVHAQLRAPGRRHLARRELLDPIVEVLALADADRLQRSSRSIPQTVFGVAGNDRLMIGRAAVDDDAIRSAVALQGLPEEALGCRQVAVFAEEELGPCRRRRRRHDRSIDRVS
ncbi:hypothetical protein MES5069_310003 [Mesorhizobium escarrei]|uniref:Uncharacterized protein n=1 Tax=Mesorhizobium escarrei TaxID=666018 RepID=A0ABM9DZN5_9HYPH|nr:hypothetical protein MES5069_310003 [Mesorhizobium escarrei]